MTKFRATRIHAVLAVTVAAVLLVPWPSAAGAPPPTPVLLGGSSVDGATAVAIGPDGSRYVAGCTFSADLPVGVGGPDSSLNGSSDAFVVKFDPSGGGVSFATFLGGNGEDCAHDLALDASGSIFIAGETSSTDFPAGGPAADPTANGGIDGFVARLNGTTGVVEWSTYLGGAGDDRAFALALGTSQGPSSATDVAQAIAIAGRTGSADFPTTPGAFQAESRDFGESRTDAFVLELAASGDELLFSTRIGGNGNDTASDVAIGPGGALTVVGWTDAGDFPTTSASAKPTRSGAATEAFALRLDAGGATLQFSTYVGGTGSDYANSVAVRPTGESFVAGLTYSSDFPLTLGAPDFDMGGTSDAFLAELDAAGGALTFSSYLGGLETETAYSAQFGADGYAYIVGSTQSRDFPTTSIALQRNLEGIRDAFVAVVDTPSRSLLFSTYLGGDGKDAGAALEVAHDGSITLVGSTDSSDFPGANGSAEGGSEDAFFLMLPAIAAHRVQLLSTPTGVPLTVDGLEVATPTVVWWAPGSLHSVAASPVREDDGVRYRFGSWSDGGDMAHLLIANSDLSLEAVWRTEYLLVVSTPFGDPHGMGWHQAGTRATIGIGTAEVVDAGQRWSFDGWEGPAETAGSETTVMMDGPREVKVRWRAEGLAPPAGGVSPVAAWISVSFVLVGLTLQFSSRANYGAASLLLVPLFTRLRRSDLRNQYNRGRIAQFIEDYPGSSFSQIRIRLGVSNGACAYHLRVLEKNELVRRVVQGPSVRFYASSYRFTDEVLPPLAYYQRRILEVLVKTDGASFGQIADALHKQSMNIGKSNLNYHLKTLTRDKEIVQARREGRNTIYYVEVGEREALARRLREEARLDRFLEDAETGPDPDEARPIGAVPINGLPDIVVKVQAPPLRHALRTSGDDDEAVE